MKFNVIILLMLLSIIKMSFAQTEQPYQPIIEPSQEELAKIGITLKGNFIVYYNDIPNKFKFGYLNEKGNINIPIHSKDSVYYKNDVGKINLTHFDFYPYYISAMDSSMGYTYWKSGYENKLKHDPLFKKKMFNYLVPVKIRTYGAKKKQVKYKLYWFTPTESFCRILSNYNIKRRFVTDKDITSDVALLLSDEVLKKIGFIFGKKEMFLSTYMNDPKQSTAGKTFIIKWYNNKKESRTIVHTNDTEFKFNGNQMFDGFGITGALTNKYNVDNELNSRDRRNKDYDMKTAGYYIVKTIYANGGRDYFLDSYKGKVIPIYIENSKRKYKEKKGVVIYLKYSENLTKLIWNWEEVKDIYTLDMN